MKKITLRVTVISKAIQTVPYVLVLSVLFKELLNCKNKGQEKLNKKCL